MADDTSVTDYLAQPGAVDPGIEAAVEQAVAKESELETKYGDKPIEAAAGEAASTLTFGLSDQALRKLGVSPERLREVRERSPVASGLAEAAAIVAPAIASGGTSTAAKGLAKAGAGLSAATRVGELAATGIESVLKDKVRKAALRDIIKTSAAMGTEGALFNVGNLIEDHALDKVDLNAQNIVASAGAGAMLGAGFGGLFGAAKASVPLVKRGLAPLGKNLSKLTDPVAASIELVGLTPEKMQKILRIKPQFAEELPSYLVNKLGLKIGTTSEELLSKNSALLQDAGKRIGSTIDELEAHVAAMPGETAYKVLQNRPTIYRRLIETLESEESRLAPVAATSRGELRVLKEMKKDLLKKALAPTPVSLKELDDLRKLYQGMKFNKAGNALDNFKANTADSLRSNLRDVVDTIATNIDELGVAETSGLAQKLKNANNDFFTASQLSRTLPKKLNTKQLVTLTDLVEGSVLGTVGSVAGIPGAGIGLGVAAGRKLAKSDLRRKVAIIADLKNQNLAATKRINDAIAGFVKATKKPGRQLSLKAMMHSGFAADYETNTPAKNQKEAYQNVLKNVGTLQNDPEMFTERLAKTTARISQVSPDIALETQETLIRAMMYIAQNIPRDPSQGTNTIFERHYQPSSMEMARMERIVQAVENPFSILEDLEHGTLTREHVNAVKVVYPAVYAAIRTQAIERIATDGQTMNYNRKVQAGILLDIPTDESLMPYAIAGLQSNFAQQNADAAQVQQGAVAPTTGGLQDLGGASRTATDTQQVASRKSRP